MCTVDVGSLPRINRNGRLRDQIPLLASFEGGFRPCPACSPRRSTGLEGRALGTSLLPLTMISLCAVQAEFTGQSIEQITMDTDRDYFMSAQEAVEYGLIDAVVTRPQVMQASLQ